ncbi:MAG: TetR/AcrR family transcriptional regulator [Bacteroidota bacterium]
MAKNPRNNGKRDVILKEAAKLFKEKSFGGASMRELAERVGIEAPSMYHHIASKDEILEIICFSIGNLYVSQLEDISRRELSVIEKLKELIRLHVRIMIKNGDAVSVANNDWKHLSDEKLKKFKELRSGYEKKVVELLKEGVESGELKAVNTSVTLFTILSAIRWVELWWRPNRGISAEELEESIITILLEGLVK